MHLLATQSGVIGDGQEAIDLQQDSADIVVLSSADSDLACLARAYDTLPQPRPSLRLANILHLQHNMSVDLYAERTLSRAKLIIVRQLGGKAYWPYGIDVIEALARQQSINLAVLPGDQFPDPALLRHNTVSPLAVERLRLYFAEGGVENIANAIRFGQFLIREGPEPVAAKRLARCGLYREASGNAPIAAVVFYRALIESAFTEPIDVLGDSLLNRGLNPVCVFVQSLKDRESALFIANCFAEHPPSIIINTTAFAIATATGEVLDNPFRACDCPVLQAILAGTTELAWQQNSQGLSARDLAMNVVLPELDGRILTRALSFKTDAGRHEGTQCRIVKYKPQPSRIEFTTALAANWVKLHQTPAPERRIAIVLANYPNRDGRVGNGVGYDTPASTINIMKSLAQSGYCISDIPSSGNDLIEELLIGPTNQSPKKPRGGAKLGLDIYLDHFGKLSGKIQDEIHRRWGAPESDPFFAEGAFDIAVRQYGSVVIGIQPARGYNIDPKSSYHDPALVPPHGYFAFYIWLGAVFGAHALIHNGKHGNLEWLPGKAVALSDGCYPEAVFGALPHLYPFIVNDPGEGTQAKRRSGAVIIDHLTPPLTRAEAYGPLRDLEALVDEYYLASSVDRRRATALRDRIFEAAHAAKIDVDAGINDDESDGALQRLDAWLCDLKEAQIRDGLHVLGETPTGRLERDLIAALVRAPRKLGEGADRSLLNALAADLGFGGFDPLSCAMAEPWSRARPKLLADLLPSPWRTNGDTVERLELLAAHFIESPQSCSPQWPATRTILDEVSARIRPALYDSGKNELANLLKGLDGRFVEPGPAGAPTRGRLDVLPTGRNFFSIDNRAVPTPTAWSLGQRSAEAMLLRHFQEHGTFPRAMGLSVWGTSNMRTGGDDIAQALALIGAKPRWDPSSWRVSGFEITPLSALGRPRVDVTLRISGFFRDAFPLQIELFDRAVRAIGDLDEIETDNPIAARMRSDAAELVAQGAAGGEAAQIAGQRIFGSKPGTYGAGLQAIMDEKLWAERSDLARAYVAWGSYAYGAIDQGTPSETAFQRRLKTIEAVVHNQDNREHDLLDSDDYYQFEGGMTAAVEQASGERPAVYHNDHSRPDRPVIRTLEEEIARVVRSRVVNPKWIAGVMRHGYKGAFEIVATVDYLFAFSATTGAARSHHFDLAYDAFIADEQVQGFIAANNRSALKELAERFTEAIVRGLWTPRSNSAYSELSRLMEGSLQ
ncbi:MAG TPA: cobaltochelatase subunit CobN [Aestuariivirgaceae bacterium]|jgi:cobaltochelatase CobN